MPQYQSINKQYADYLLNLQNNIQRAQSDKRNFNTNYVVNVLDPRLLVNCKVINFVATLSKNFITCMHDKTFSRRHHKIYITLHYNNKQHYEQKTSVNDHGLYKLLYTRDCVVLLK